jgi:hypothetical protein
MTPSKLKYNIEVANPSSMFFSRGAMKAFGDTMRNYGVRTTNIKTLSRGHGVVITECWELYRKKPVNHGLQKSSYFDKQTFKQVFNNYDD